MSGITGQISQGFLLGLASGTSCLLTCGAIYLPYLIQSKRTTLANFKIVLEISGGRFLSYLVIGALAGLLGNAMDPQARTWFTVAAYLLFPIFLIMSAVGSYRFEKNCAASRFSSATRRPFILGILTGLNVCPPFLIAFANAVTVSGPVSGMIFFTAFFVGTSIFILPLSFFGVAGKQTVLRYVARVAAIGVSLWYLVQAGILIYTEVHDSYVAKHDTRPIVGLMDSTTAVVLVKDSAQCTSPYKSFLAQRVGTYQIVIDTAHIPPGYIFIEHPYAEQISAATALRSSNRFICILPDLSGDSALVAPRIKSIAEFLKFYLFRFDIDSGTVYWVPENGAP